MLLQLVCTLLIGCLLTDAIVIDRQLSDDGADLDMYSAGSSDGTVRRPMKARWQQLMAFMKKNAMAETDSEQRDPFSGDRIQMDCGRASGSTENVYEVQMNAVIDALSGKTPDTSAQHSWPWMAIMKIVRSKEDGNLSTTMCGASVIGRRWVITASHCIRHFDYKNYSIVVGTNFLKSESQKQILTVRAVTNHPMWHKPSMTYDCAIIEVNEDIIFNEAVQPICISSDSTDLPPTAILAGWGRLGNNSQTGLSPVLRQVALPFVDLGYCKRIFRSHAVFFRIDEKYSLCAGARGLGTCHGDSGSPLMIPRGPKGRWHLVGIASFVKWCPDVPPYFPGVFSRVPEFCDFIRETTRHDVICR